MAPISYRAAIRGAFLRAIDDRHVLLPERVGKNRFDNLINLLENSAIGMSVLVPGMDEMLRINGRARITDDPRLLADSTVKGRAPKIGLLITVDEAFLHCPKALVHSGS